MAAFQTMNAIKRKMHKLKTDKETEYDRVDQLEQKLVELRTLNEKVTDCRHIELRYKVVVTFAHSEFVPNFFFCGIFCPQFSATTESSKDCNAQNCKLLRIAFQQAYI